MKFPTFARSNAPSGEDEKVSPPTAALSKSSSESEIEKKVQHSIGSKTSHPQDDKILEAAPVQEVAPLEKPNDEPEYPGGVKLFIITIALCLSVFCMALVHLPMLFLLHDKVY